MLSSSAMLSSAEILVTYETLSGLMRTMLVAARDGDWDRLVELEHHAQTPIGRLQEASAIRLAPAEQHQKLGLIQRILKDDAAIRDLTVPRLAFLQERIGLARSGRESVRAYR